MDDDFNTANGVELSCLTWLNGLIQAIMIKRLKMLLKNTSSLWNCFQRGSP